MTTQSLEEQYVRNSYKNEVLYFSDHAYEKMFKTKRSKADVVDCIKGGGLIEVQAGYEGESPRLVFYNGHECSFYVVVAVSMPTCVVITVCDTDFAKWEKDGANIKRK